MKKCLVTGITGQTGSYLAELLLDKGYEVHGLVRRSSTHNTLNIDHVINHLHLHYGDLVDGACLSNLIWTINPDEIYNMGAMSQVGVSFRIPSYTTEVVGNAANRILETMCVCNRDAKFYQASTSELYGNSPAPQNEYTPMSPNSPYSVAKYHAYLTVKNYRHSYDMFACQGILFNHESERRSEDFVTRKISLGVANIVAGNHDNLKLGNLKALRDWGYAPEYADAIYRIMQLPYPTDIVIGTGETHTIEDFVNEAFGYVGLDWNNYVVVDQSLYRPAEVNFLQADITKAKNILNWQPKVTFKELVRIMVENDLKLVRAKKTNFIHNS